MKQKSLVFTLTLVAFVAFGISSAFCATYYTRASGNITGNIWGTSTTGTGGALPALANGDVIYIDDDVTITSNVDWANRNLTIYLNSKVTISGQWLLSSSTSIIFQTSSAKVDSIGGGNSDKIKFGNGNNGWSGNDGDLTGPGTLDASFNPGTSPLPVELLFFKATSTEKKITLSWATASELDFDYFVVERSIDAKEFTEVGQIKGHGTTQTRNDYQLEDDEPLIGKNYYRLKSVDYDGFSEYFKVVVADYAAEKSFSIAPSPSDGTSVKFFLNFSPEENSKIVVYNSLGMTVGITSATDRNPSLTFNAGLRSGIYYAKLVSKNFMSVERFIVR